MPGKIIQKLSKVGVKNPLFLLDEVDKMAMDFRGDPARRHRGVRLPAELARLAHPGHRDPRVAHRHVLLHAQSERGHLATRRHGGVGDLLDAVQVAGEAGGDDPPVGLFHEELAQHRPHGDPARRAHIDAAHRPDRARHPEASFARRRDVGPRATSFVRRVVPAGADVRAPEHSPLASVA